MISLFIFLRIIILFLFESMCFFLFLFFNVSSLRLIIKSTEIFMIKKMLNPKTKKCFIAFLAYYE